MFTLLVQAAAAQTAEPEAWSLDGTPLYPPTFSGLTLEALDAQLSIAKAALRTPPTAEQLSGGTCAGGVMKGQNSASKTYFGLIQTPTNQVHMSA